MLAPPFESEWGVVDVGDALEAAGAQVVVQVAGAGAEVEDARCRGGRRRPGVDEGV